MTEKLKKNNDESHACVVGELKSKLFHVYTTQSIAAAKVQNENELKTPKCECLFQFKTVGLCCYAKIKINS
jgi:hypothetical protein